MTKELQKAFSKIEFQVNHWIFLLLNVQHDYFVFEEIFIGFGSLEFEKMN